MGKDYYKILGVEKGADDAALKKGQQPAILGHIWGLTASLTDQPPLLHMWVITACTTSVELMCVFLRCCCCSIPQVGYEMAPSKWNSSWDLACMHEPWQSKSYQQ